MTSPHATANELASFLSATAELDGSEADRLLLRASERIDGYVRAQYDVDDDGIATDEDLAAALRDATCAQIEFWIEVGEEHDVEGLSGTQASIMGLSLSKLPPELAPRARTILDNAGLFNLTPDLPLDTVAFV